MYVSSYAYIQVPSNIIHQYCKDLSHKSNEEEEDEESKFREATSIPDILSRCFGRFDFMHDCSWICLPSIS